MKVLIFGASGMLGRATLRQCLNSSEVKKIITPLRSNIAEENPKLEKIIIEDFLKSPNLEELIKKNSPLTACFICLGDGITQFNKERYYFSNYTLPIELAKIVLKYNPQIKLSYISGIGVSLKSKIYFLRIKAEAEKKLLELSKNVFILRPLIFYPEKDIKSKTKGYRYFYFLFRPLLFIFKFLIPQIFLTTQELGKIMIFLAKNGFKKNVLGLKDFSLIKKELEKI